MFTVIPKQDMLIQLQEALTGKLADVVMVFPDLKEKVEQGMLWAIFSKEAAYEIDHEDYKRHHSAFAYISYDLVSLAKKEVEKTGEVEPQFFAPAVEKIIQQKDYKIYLDYEDCDVKVEAVSKTPLSVNKEFQGIVAATLPDSDIVFESLIKGSLFDDANTWLLEYMDTYEEWKHETMSKLYDYLWQVGGHGRWIQGDYNEVYVGQVNIEIGDAGSVFLEARDEEVKGYVDMY